MSAPENDRLEFGDRLRELREQAGYTRGQIAKATGWHPSKVARLENGQQLATDGEVLIWARFTRTPEPIASELREELEAITGADLSLNE